MRVARPLPLTLALVAASALVCGSAVTAHARLTADGPKTSTKSIVTPQITATLGQAQYQPGETMVLTVAENIWAKRTFSVTDSSGAVWTQASDDNKAVTFTATALSKGGTVTVLMTRTFDRATAGASASYTVALPPPPPPSAPKAAWPGQQPGKFYLGMSCGTQCATQEATLGQSYGVHRQYKLWNDWKGLAKDIQQDHAADRLPWISVKPPLSGAAGWKAIADGDYDADIATLGETLMANDDKPVLFTFHHEPSNDGTEEEGALWAAAYAHIHDLLKAQGALANVADPPILGDWLFNPTNRGQDPANWATKAVLDRAPFLGVDMYENESGETMAVRIPRILDWMAERGYPKLMVGIAESGATDQAYSAKSANEWINESLSWVAANTDKVGVVSYFNSMNNSRSGVYWPLDETSAKLANYRSWLKNPAVID